MTIECPRCRKSLEAVALGAVQADVCRVCEGIWFDKGELLRAFTSAGGTLKGTAAAASWEGQKRGGEQPGRHELACPRCGARLERYRYGGTTEILVDGCEKDCGLWIDDGELKHAYEHLAQTQKPLAPEEKKKLLAGLRAAEGERARKEALFVENLTTLDDSEGPAGAVGAIIQFFYGTFYKAGLR